MLPMFKKEMRTYFTNMTGYAFLTFMLLMMGMFFAFMNIFMGTASFQLALDGANITFFILVPILTMRLFAEEVRNKTDQLLFTSPLSVVQIVLGKFAAALTLFVIGVGITILFPLMMSRFSVDMPVAQIAGSYIGFILMGACCIAVGLFISVLTDNQITAAVSTFAAIFVMFVMDILAISMPTSATASLIFVAVVILAVAFIWYNATRNVLTSVILGAIGLGAAYGMYLFNNLFFDGIIVRALLWFSIYARFGHLGVGVLNLSDLVYYISFAALFIYLTINVIEKRRWR